MKGVKDPVTQADIKVQALILKGLKQFWPQIKIVAEEDIDYQGEFEFDFKNLRTDILSPQLFQDFNEFNLQDAVVWIDPLDGTLSYVSKEYDAVTTLIGVSVNKRAHIGIIGQPYNSKLEFKPTIYFSHVNQKAVYFIEANQIKENTNPSILQKLYLKSNQKEFNVCVSSGHTNQFELNTIQDKLKPTNLIKIGGAGNKILSVLQGKSDLYISLSSKGLKRWDICAGDAFLTSLGGFATNIYGEQYDYQFDSNQYATTQGFLATLDKEIYQQTVQKFKEPLFKL